MSQTNDTFMPAVPLPAGSHTPIEATSRDGRITACLNPQPTAAPTD